MSRKNTKLVHCSRANKKQVKFNLILSRKIFIIFALQQKKSQNLFNNRTVLQK